MSQKYTVSEWAELLVSKHQAQQEGRNPSGHCLTEGDTPPPWETHGAA